MKIAIEATVFTKREAGIYRYGVNLLRAMKIVEPSVVMVPVSASNLIGIPPIDPRLFAQLFGKVEIPFIYQVTEWNPEKKRGVVIRYPHFFQSAYHRHCRALKDMKHDRWSAVSSWLRIKREFHRCASGMLDFVRNSHYRKITRQYVESDTLILHSIYDALPEDLGAHKPALVCQTVHDIIPLLFTRSYHRGFEKVVESARRADLLIVISESTKRDLLTLEGFEDSNIEVIPLAADPVFKPASTEQIQRMRRKTGIPMDAPYFLSVSTVEPRKNFPFLLRAFQKLIRTPGAPACRLVLAGADGWGEAMREITPLLEELKDHVHYTGFVSDEELSALYSGAEAFMFPSLYEGFGLPVLEAMACGTKVICSHTSSLPEVVADAGILLPPSEEEPWVQAMNHALQRTPAERERDRDAAIARADVFSWEKTARLTLAAYAKALSRKAAAVAFH